MTAQTEFTMPSLGADMDEGTIVEWLVKPGDEVHKGDIVAVVDTAKAAVEVECFDNGFIQRLLVEPGNAVPIGTPLAVIASAPAEAAAEAEAPAEVVAATAAQAPVPVPAPAPMPEQVSVSAEPHVSSPIVRHLAEQLGVDLETVTGTGKAGTITRADVQRAATVAAAPPPTRRKTASRRRKAAPAKAAPAKAAPAKAAPAAPGGPGPSARPRVSPLARRLAAELGVDLTAVIGSGAQGAIRADDVRTAAHHRIAEPAAQPVAERPAVKQTAQQSADRRLAMRQAIGKLMARSKREIPHYYLSTTIDMTAALGWMRERNRDLPVPERLLPAALLLKATALAARKVPDLNGFWIDDAFVPAETVNLGMAVSLRGGGLVTPAIHDTAALPLTGLMAALKDVAVRARSGRLRGSELTGATITVTNLGDQGVESVTGVIFPPQVALVGIGKVVERPWAVDGLLGVRPVVTVTLAADHRATDGYTGARFLETVARLLQRPEELES